MRLFGRVDDAINRYDRAIWITGGPWGGFDLQLAPTGFVLLQRTPDGKWFAITLG